MQKVFRITSILTCLSICLILTLSPLFASASFFTLISPRETKVPEILSAESVDGIAIQLSWADLEPKNDEYDWSTLDKLMNEAKGKKKKVTLHIVSSVFVSAPTWLKETGVGFYTYQDFHGKLHNDPIPWDANYLKEYNNLLGNLKSHLASSRLSSTLYAISIAAPVPEMSLVGCRNGKMGDLAYDRNKYLDAWKESITLMKTHFPKVQKLIPAPVGVICGPEKDSEFYLDIIGFIHEKKWTKFILFATDLTADGSERLTPYLDQEGKYTRLGYQMMWSSTNDPKLRMKGSYPTNLKEALCIGLSHKSRYFEIYPGDILSKEVGHQEARDIMTHPQKCQ